MVKVFDPDPSWQPTELIAKLDCGAAFMVTQACLDTELLRRYLAILVAHRVTWRCRVVVSVPIVTTLEDARWLYENSKGIAIPAGLVSGFENTQDPADFGVRYSASVVRALRELPGISGVNLSSLGGPEAIVDVARLSEK